MIRNGLLAKRGKVFHLIPSLETGGTEKGLLLTIPRLDPDKFQSVVCSLTPRIPLAGELKAMGIPVYSLGAKSKWDIRVVGRMFSLLRREKPDLLHSYQFHTNILARVIGRIAGVPVILNSERSINLDGAHRVCLNRLTRRLATAVETNSNAGKSYVSSRLGFDPEKVFVIRQGVMAGECNLDGSGFVKERFGIVPEAAVLGFVGRLHPVKGLTNCIQALGKVAKELPGTKLLLVGDGPDRGHLEGLCYAEGLHGSVIFAGEHSDVSPFVACVDVLVLSSLAEGSPRVVLEAMAMGKPVVATRVGGMSEVVEDGVTGILVPPADSDQLAQALLKLLFDKNVARQMGINAKRRVQSHFTLEHTVARYEELYSRLLHL